VVRLPGGTVDQNRVSENVQSLIRYGGGAPSVGVFIIQENIGSIRYVVASLSCNFIVRMRTSVDAGFPKNKFTGITRLRASPGHGGQGVFLDFNY
jgi:hypothetical protein